MRLKGNSESITRVVRRADLKETRGGTVEKNEIKHNFKKDLVAFGN